MPELKNDAPVNFSVQVQLILWCNNMSNINKFQINSLLGGTPLTVEHAHLLRPEIVHDSTFPKLRTEENKGKRLQDSNPY